MPDVPGRGERPPRRLAAALVLRGGGRGLRGGDHLGQGEEGAGRRARVPPRQPPVGLPRVRQGRRVPPPGPDPGLRAGREPVRGGEAPLREARPHLRPGAARPRALYPVRPAAPASPPRSPARPRSTSSGVATSSRSTPSPSCHSPPTSRATPSRSARWGRSPPPSTGSPPAPGTSTRWSPPAPPCAVGCRVAVQSSANRVTRLLGIDADPVNHGWLCDKGRFAYESVNSDDRLIEPMVRKNGELVPATWYEALRAVADGLKKAAGSKSAGSKSAGSSAAGSSAAGSSARGVGVIGGARLTNEGAYAWAKLAKGILGTDSVDAQLGDGLPPEFVLGLPRATIDQAATADTVVLLSGDLRGELPRPLLAPAVRRGRRRPVRGRAVAPDHLAHPVRRSIAPLPGRRGLRSGRRGGGGRRRCRRRSRPRGRRRRCAGRGPSPGRRRERGGGGGPTVAGRGRGPGGGGRP